MSLQGKKILVVDDEEGIRDLVVSEFEFNGATCLQASSGKEAFEVYKAQSPDAVVSDIRMPNGDGLFFLDEIQKANITPCPMIFMTGYSDVPVEEFYDRGVEAVISKPFRLEQLVNTLDMAMRSRRMGWRRATRIVSSLRVVVSWPEQTEALASQTFTVGRGGMFIHSTICFPKINSKAHFKIIYQHEGVEQFIEGDVTVRWVRKESLDDLPLGFGCQFLDLNDDQLDLIGSLAGLAKRNPFIPKA
ncbi:MAG: hypothetical protein RJB66_63 [Pseudomonadota bacterium]|jgi:CheY-like chemotaxis protein